MDEVAILEFLRAGRAALKAGQTTGLQPATLADLVGDDLPTTYLRFSEGWKEGEADLALARDLATK
jgi:hypothetical protein